MVGLGSEYLSNTTVGGFAAIILTLEANIHSVRSKHRQLFFLIWLFNSSDAFNENTKIN